MVICVQNPPEKCHYLYKSIIFLNFAYLARIYSTMRTYAEGLS